MKVSMSKTVFAVLAAAAVLLGSQWASAANLPTWGGQTTTNQPQPIQRSQPTIVSQPAANVALSVQIPQPGTWTAPGTTSGTSSGATVITPTQRPRSFQPKARSMVTPRTGFSNRGINFQPKALGQVEERRASGFGPQLPAIAPVTTCSGYRQTPDVDRLTAPPRYLPYQLATFTPRSAPGADLHCTDLRGAFLYRVDFKGANLRGANLSGVDLLGADFTGAFLEDADMTGADAVAANFTNARLNRTNLSNTIIEKANGADFRGAIINNLGLAGSLKNAHFDGLDFRKLRTFSSGLGADFSGGTFAGTNFSGISIHLSDFSNAYLVRDSFENASISAAKFVGADLSLADFSNALLREIDFSNATLTGAKFIATESGYMGPSGRLADRGNSLVEPRLDFTNAMAVDTDFSRAYLYKEVFKGTNMLRAIFDGAMLRNSVFSKNNLTEASFVGSDLRESFVNGVNAEKARLDSSKLAGSFISGSNFKQASMSNVEMNYSKIHDASFYQANLEQSGLINSEFKSVDLRMANFQGSDLSHSVFTPSTQLNGANFTGSNLTAIWECSLILHPRNSYQPSTCQNGFVKPLDLRSVNFRNADFSSVRLYGSDFRNSNLSGSNLDTFEEKDKDPNITYEGKLEGERHGYKLSGAIMPDGTVHP